MRFPFRPEAWNQGVETRFFAPHRPTGLQYTPTCIAYHVCKHVCTTYACTMYVRTYLNEWPLQKIFQVRKILCRTMHTNLY